jgi:hypothetical protein
MASSSDSRMPGPNVRRRSFPSHFCAPSCQPHHTLASTGSSSPARAARRSISCDPRPRRHSLANGAPCTPSSSSKRSSCSTLSNGGPITRSRPATVADPRLSGNPGSARRRDTEERPPRVARQPAVPEEPSEPVSLQGVLPPVEDLQAWFRYATRTSLLGAEERVRVAVSQGDCPAQALSPSFQSRCDRGLVLS